MLHLLCDDKLIIKLNKTEDKQIECFYPLLL